MKPHSIATCDREIGAGSVPEWVHLLPLGEIKARDGRRFRLSNPANILAKFQQNAVDLPIDYEHQNDREERGAGPFPAAGWIKELDIRSDGLWGRVEWTARASELIGSREYRYLSPTFFFEKQSREINRIKGAGLVHSPALHLKALASESEGKDDTMSLMEKLIELLNLSSDATEEEIIAAFETALESNASEPDPSKYVPISALEDLLKERNSQAEKASEEFASVKVNNALEKGFITPAMKEWAISLCRTNADAFDNFIQKSTPAYAHLSEVVTPRGRPPASRAEVGDAELEVCQQLGIDPEKFSR